MTTSKEKFTRLTIEQSMVKITWENPCEDIDLIDIINAFFTLCCLLGFSKEMVLRIAEDYIDCEKTESSDEQFSNE